MDVMPSGLNRKRSIQSANCKVQKPASVSSVASVKAPYILKDTYRFWININVIWMLCIYATIQITSFSGTSLLTVLQQGIECLSQRIGRIGWGHRHEWDSWVSKIMQDHALYFFHKRTPSKGDDLALNTAVVHTAKTLLILLKLYKWSRISFKSKLRRRTLLFITPTTNTKLTHPFAFGLSDQVKSGAVIVTLLPGKTQSRPRASAHVHTQTHWRHWHRGIKREKKSAAGAGGGGGEE